MAAKTEPRNGIKHTWDLGENGWNTGMDENLLKIGLVGMHLSVLDKDTSTPPATPADGDSYLVGPTATDAWVGLENQIVVYDDDIADWRAYEPRKGWLTFVEDEDAIYIYKDSSWEAYSSGSGTASELTGYYETEATADASGGTASIDYSAANVHIVTIGDGVDAVLTITNAPATGKAASLTLLLSLTGAVPSSITIAGTSVDLTDVTSSGMIIVEAQRINESWYFGGHHAA
jgi:hypothetical protein